MPGNNKLHNSAVQLVAHPQCHQLHNELAEVFHGWHVIYFRMVGATEGPREPICKPRSSSRIRTLRNANKVALP